MIHGYGWGCRREMEVARGSGSLQHIHWLRGAVGAAAMGLER